MNDLVLIAIAEFIRKHQYSPTVREIAKELDRSPATILFHFKKLKEHGLITYKEKMSRTVKLTVK